MNIELTLKDCPGWEKLPKLSLWEHCRIRFIDRSPFGRSISTQPTRVACRGRDASPTGRGRMGESVSEAQAEGVWAYIGISAFLISIRRGIK